MKKTLLRRGWWLGLALASGLAGATVPAAPAPPAPAEIDRLVGTIRVALDEAEPQLRALPAAA